MKGCLSLLLYYAAWLGLFALIAVILEQSGR